MASVSSRSSNRGNSIHNLETARYCVCDFCRIKKIKCDMVRPVCGNCRLRCATCTYSKRKKKPGPPKRHAAINLTMSEPDNRHEPNQECSDVSSFSMISQPGAVDSRDANYDCTQLIDLFEGPSMMECEAEAYLLNLFFLHVQPIYPLFRRRAACAKDLSVRLKMAAFSVACRFATPESRDRLLLLSPATYAERARGLAYIQSDSLCIDDIRASLLLCIHEMVDSGQWNSVAEVSKLAKMADMYQATSMDAFSVNIELGFDAEEWRSVWWTIYSLDTICSAVTASSHATAKVVQDCVGLPTVSVPSFTNSSPDGSRHREQQGDLQMLQSNAKHWETMQSIYNEPRCRSRNLGLGCNSIMRSVTDARLAARCSHDPGLFARLHALESECAAVTFALPSWVFNPMQNSGIRETAEEHRSRLISLLIFLCARLLIKITSAQVQLRSRVATRVEAATFWQTILDEAGEVTSVLQHWKPAYFEVADPMIAYIAYLATCVLIINCKSASNQSVTENSGHIDLSMLFLTNIGRYWPIGNRLKDSLCSLQTLPADLKVENMLERIFQVTAFPQSNLEIPSLFERTTIPTLASNVESETTSFFSSDCEITQGISSAYLDCGISNADIGFAWLHDPNVSHSEVTEDLQLY